MTTAFEKRCRKVAEDMDIGIDFYDDDSKAGAHEDDGTLHVVWSRSYVSDLKLRGFRNLRRPHAHRCRLIRFNHSLKDADLCERLTVHALRLVILMNPKLF